MHQHRYVSKLMIAVQTAAVLLVGCGQSQEDLNSPEYTGLYSVEQVTTHSGKFPTKIIFVVGTLRKQMDGTYILIGSGEGSSNSSVRLLFSGRPFQDSDMSKCNGRETVVTGVLKSETEIEVEFVNLDTESVSNDTCYLNF